MKKRIIIFRLDAIGDFILWLDAAKKLRAKFPKEKYEITIVGQKFIYDITEKCPYWDEFISIDLKKYFSNPFYRWYHRLKFYFTRCELCLYPLYSRNNVAEQLIKFVKAKRKFGIDGDFSTSKPEYLEKNKKIYTDVYRVAEEFELKKNIEFINHVCNSNYNIELPNLAFVNCTKKYDCKEYIVIVPGASTKVKQWEIEKFIFCIKQIKIKYDLNVLICGNREEFKLGSEILSKCNGIINLIGQTSLIELVSIIKKAKAVLSNDTSVVHIAAAVKTPCVCILGGGHFGRFAPYPDELDSKVECVYNKMDCFNCNWKCKLQADNKKPYPCISSITVDQVMEKVDKILTTDFTD